LPQGGPAGSSKRPKELAWVVAAGHFAIIPRPCLGLV